ncbi:cellulose binding domain-containing protein [Dactylosporangium vinaceum]|uniref:Cellulose binding domain-containing protein n=1 Tax=Dactylosporangium vinaceum TaxID=53362 RepID=A0ABV5MIQ8_9ACTN|nr:cellulose binding domain-containing protein [Dactylosporangium vinaceum]
MTQSGSTVTAKNAGYNGSIATNGTASFGFNGSATGSNPVPTAFTLNGTSCTGGVTSTPTPTRTASSPTPTPTGGGSNPGGVPSDAAWVATGAWETAYDIWANNNAYEVMIWTNQHGAVGPIAESYDANGAVPNARNVSAGGHTWNVYRGSNGANAVFSFVRTGNTNSGTVDVLAVMNWLRTNGWWGDVNVGQVQFGFEVSGTAGQSSFVCNTFTLTYS